MNGDKTMKSFKSHSTVKALSAALVLVFMLSAFTACADDKKPSRPSNVTDETEEMKPSASGNTVETTDNTTAGSEETTDEMVNGTTENPDYVYKGRWTIWKTHDKDGVKWLQVYNSGFYQRIDEMDYLEFFVFENEADARNRYDYLYDRSKSYDGGKFWEEGDSWFISKQPDVMDASHVWMCYLDGNVIIHAVLGSPNTWETRINGGDPAETAAVEHYDQTLLKDYILNNEPAIIKFVNDLTADVEI